jgi:hypothetical protein
MVRADGCFHQQSPTSFGQCGHAGLLARTATAGRILKTSAAEAQEAARLHAAVRRTTLCTLVSRLNWLKANHLLHGVSDETEARVLSVGSLHPGSRHGTTRCTLCAFRGQHEDVRELCSTTGAAQNCFFRFTRSAFARMW